MRVQDQKRLFLELYLLVQELLLDFQSLETQPVTVASIPFLNKDGGICFKMPDSLDVVHFLNI